MVPDYEDLDDIEVRAGVVFFYSCSECSYYGP
jgi:hypothetical protein